MEKNILLVFLSFLWTSAMAKTSDYVPFLEEGKSWGVTYMTHENTSSYKRTYMVKGDTIIGDRLYKK